MNTVNSRPAPQADESLYGRAGARPLRVLVVDDDRDTVLTLMALLREEGHDTKGVHSGRHAVQAVRDFDADAVIMDIAMPEKSGWDTAREIRDAIGRARPLLIAPLASITT